MINKQVLTSIIDKYYLGLNESVKWIINDNTLEIRFMTPTKDVIGSVKCNDFKFEDCELAIYDTKKLSNLISICYGDLFLEVEKTNKLCTKLYISDNNFNLTYALSDPLLIGKAGTVNIPEWAVKLTLTIEDINNIIKAKSALSGIDNMLVTTDKSLDDEPLCRFIFGDESGHNNKITYQILGDITEQNLKIPFNSDIFKTILQSNKDMESAYLNMSKDGLMQMVFNTPTTTSEYFMVRKAETNF